MADKPDELAIVIDSSADDADMKFYGDLLTAVSQAIAAGRIVMPSHGVQEATIKSIRLKAGLE